MNEGQVTLDNVTRKLPAPFFVIATQNPVDYQGTYPLPEAQLDRFLLRVRLGYPAFEDAMKMLLDRKNSDPLDALSPVSDAAALSSVQAAVKEVHVSEDIGKYILYLIEATRELPEVELGASPRAALGLFQAARAAAYLDGRDWVGASDVQKIAEPVLAHRILLTVKARYGGVDVLHLIKKVIQSVEVPA